MTSLRRAVVGVELSLAMGIELLVKRPRRPALGNEKSVLLEWPLGVQLAWHHLLIMTIIESRQDYCVKNLPHDVAKEPCHRELNSRQYELEMEVIRGLDREDGGKFNIEDARWMENVTVVDYKREKTSLVLKCTRIFQS
jgi:hypothetical protein